MGVGIFLVVAAVVFGFVGPWAFVRFPLSTNVTVHYTGTFDVYVNQQTLEPLASPTRLPLTITRVVKVQSGDFSSAVVTENNTIKPGPLTYHQNYRYVMNRRSMAFENGPETMMFSQPANVDIAGTYRINFPLGSEASGAYPIWNTQSDLSPRSRNGNGPHPLKGITGVQVIDYQSGLRAPVSPYYRHWLLANGFPGSIQPAQLVPRLAAYGVDLPGLLSTLGPLLSPSQLSSVQRVLATPIPLRYTNFYRGSVAVEPTTGVMIKVRTTAEGVDATPSFAGVDQLKPLLAQYAGVPAVANLASALSRLEAAPPQRVIEYHWVQTRASSQAMANLAANQITSIDLIEAIPWVAGVAGVVLVGAGLLVRRRRHRTPPAVEVSAPTPEKVG